FVVVDADGNLVGDVAAPDDEGGSLAQLPLVRAVLRDGSAAGEMSDARDVFRVHAARIAFGDTTVGALLLGRRIDASLAADVARATGVEIAFVSSGRVLASSDTSLAGAIRGAAPAPGGTRELGVGGGRWLTRSVALDAPGA